MYLTNAQKLTPAFSASFGVLEHQKDMTYTCRLWLAYRIPEGPEEGSGSMGHCVVRLPSQRPLDKRTGPVTWPQEERSNDSRTLVNPDDDFTHIFSNAAHETCAEHKESKTKRTKIRNDAIHDEPVVDDTLKKAILDLVEDTKAKKAIFVHEQSDKALRHNISARNARGFQHAAGSDQVQDTRSRSRSTGRVTPGRPQGRSPSAHKHNQAQSLSEARQKQHVTVAEGFTSTSEAKTERLLARDQLEAREFLEYYPNFDYENKKLDFKPCGWADPADVQPPTDRRMGLGSCLVRLNPRKENLATKVMKIVEKTHSHMELNFQGHLDGGTSL